MNVKKLISSRVKLSFASRITENSHNFGQKLVFMAHAVWDRERDRNGHKRKQWFPVPM